MKDIANIINYILLQKPDYLIITGGLGPTFDDKTLQGVSAALKKRLIVNDESFKSIREKYRKLFVKGVIKTDEMLKPRVKMAMLPEGSTPLENPAGTAPAVKIVYNNTRIFCLPGVPKEVKAVFEKHIKPLLKKEMKGFRYYEKNIIVEGVAESEISEDVERIVKKVKYVYIKSHPQSYEGTARLNIHLSTRGGENRLKCLNTAVKMVEELVKSIGGKIATGAEI